MATGGSKAFSILFFLVGVSFWLAAAQTETVTGTITEDMNFFHRKLNKIPVLAATISFDVSFNFEINKDAFATMDIYTREEDRNFENTCSADSFGQLRNEDLHLSIKDRAYRNSNCSLNSDDFIRCYGDIPVQDFQPTYFSFSFGFPCHSFFNTSLHLTLKGLQYKVSIQPQTETPKCIEVQRRHTNPCQHTKYTSVPSLVGNIDILARSNPIRHWIQFFKKLLPNLLSSSVFPCHKYFFEMLCHVVLPKCDPASGYTEHVCQESCFEMLDACWDTFLATAELLVTENPAADTLHIDLDDFKKSVKQIEIANCGYLPSYNSSPSCIHWQVLCRKPPIVNNMKIDQIVGLQHQGQFLVNSAVVYSCISPDLEMAGNNTIVCLYSGEWSELSTCSAMAMSPEPIVVTIYSVPIVILVAVCGSYLVRPRFKRNKEFDAFVCYRFDTENEFVMEELIPKLSAKYALNIHSIDFTPGTNIHTNILRAIESSNCAIILVSNGFLDSPWCRQEFEMCYNETKKDRAFKLLVILMQPTGELNLSQEGCALINYFLTTNTYLECNDEHLWKKIEKHFRTVRGVTQNKGQKNCEASEEETEVFLEAETVL